MVSSARSNRLGAQIGRRSKAGNLFLVLHHPGLLNQGRGLAQTETRGQSSSQPGSRGHGHVLALNPNPGRGSPTPALRRVNSCFADSHAAAAASGQDWIEGEHMTVAARSRLAGILPSGLRLREAPALIEQARMVKDEEEIACLRSAVILGAGLFDRALEIIRPGVRETKWRPKWSTRPARPGPKQCPLRPSLRRESARRCLTAGRRRPLIPAEGFVVCDFGVILTGYCSDMTRTVYVGRPSAEARGVYQAVKQAQQAAVDAVRPGISVGEVDRAARKSLQKSGLAKYFTHSTGHGVGLEIHEAPRVAAGQTEILQPGMVITIEPGVYVPGKWGVRIEDMVVVTEHGCEVLTPTSKELVAI